eukprot:3930681-Prymnesium_polylepis.1
MARAETAVSSPKSQDTIPRPHLWSLTCQSASPTDAAASTSSAASCTPQRVAAAPSSGPSTKPIDWPESETAKRRATFGSCMSCAMLASSGCTIVTTQPRQQPCRQRPAMVTYSAPSAESTGVLPATELARAAVRPPASSSSDAPAISGSPSADSNNPNPTQRAGGMRTLASRAARVGVDATLVLIRASSHPTAAVERA